MCTEEGQCASNTKAANTREQALSEDVGIKSVKMMMMNILDIGHKAATDSTIANADYHTHQPLTTRFTNNDEIRIPVQDDLCTLPCESHIYIEGRMLKADNTVTDKTTFCNNGLAYLFSEIRYELNGIPIDSVTNPGITTTMKGYVAFTPDENYKYQNAGWFATNSNKTLVQGGTFNVCIPLKLILGFAEDYRKVVVNARQELVLIRSNSDTNAVVGDDEVVIHLDKIYWKLPHISPGLSEELSLTKYIAKGIDTQIAFRNWQLHVYPSVNKTTKHTWAVSTMSKTSTPRYIILGFQTARENDVKKNMSQFDHCNFQNVRVYLNNDRYPYDSLNVDFAGNKFAIAYEMYSAFQTSYYERDGMPLMSVQDFSKKTPLIVIDTSKQKEHLQPSSITLRIEFDTSENVAADTNAFCLVLHDRIFTYNPLTKMVNQL